VRVLSLSEASLTHSRAGKRHPSNKNDAEPTFSRNRSKLRPIGRAKETITMTSSLRSDGNDSGPITIPRDPDWDSAPLEAPAWVFVLLWSVDQFHRAGEVAFLPDSEDCWFGRGDDDLDGFAHLAQQRPGEPRPEVSREHLLTSTAISRRQLELRATATGVDMKAVGRCRTMVNGVETTYATLKDGDTVRFGGQALFLCTRRQRTMDARHWTQTLHAFGAPDAAGVVGESPAAWELRNDMAFCAAYQQHVLILGETGTGKELVARFLHDGSKRAKGPWVADNAATLSGPGVTFKLFGHAADYRSVGELEAPGLVGAADGGTLFLDHVGDMPEETQVGLHGVLDSGEYRRPGDLEVQRRSDLRIVGATCLDPKVLSLPFRARFMVKIHTPTLRDRREDTPLLIRHLMLLMLQRREKEYPGISRFFYIGAHGAMEPRVSVRLVDYLVRHPLRGNVWQLDSLLHVAVRSSTGDKVRLAPSMEEEYAMGSHAPGYDGGAERAARLKHPERLT
jgi:transcriptional regulator with PAS, ATPase and Fis domain